MRGSDVASASVRPELSSVDSLAPLVKDLRSLADCDSRAGEPLGKLMRIAADKIERLAEHVDYIEAQWLAKEEYRKAAERDNCNARKALLPFSNYITEREARLGTREADDERMLRGVTIGDFRRAREVLEDRSASLADAHSKSPSRAAMPKEANDG